MKSSIRALKEDGKLMIVEGVVKEVTVEEGKEEKDGKKKKKAKVLRKIPATVMKQAKGVAIFTSMRSGFAPLGGAGGSGMVMAKLPDGSEWLPTIRVCISDCSLVGSFIHLAKQPFHRCKLILAWSM